MKRKRPRISIFFLGGTIAMVPELDDTIVPTLTGPELVQGVSGLNQIADLDVHTILMVSSPMIELRHLRDLAQRIDANRDSDGFVVVQGTDTIEETAFALSLMVRRDVPVIMTGAMRGSLEPGADGPANLRAAVTVASTPEAAKLGVTVVLNDEIHSALFVQKTHSALASAFSSPNAGRFGFVAEGKAHLLCAPALRVPRLDPAGEFPAVCLAKIGLGDDGRLLRALPDLGYQGAVIEAMGVGHVPQPLVDLIADMITHMPVVLACRDTSGPVLRKTYGFAGSESDLRQRGIINGGFLGGLKSRVLLQLLMASGCRSKKINTVFNSLMKPLT